MQVSSGSLAGDASAWYVSSFATRCQANRFTELSSDPSKSVFPEPFLNRSCHLKRQSSKSSKAYEPRLRPQNHGLARLGSPDLANRH